MRDLDPLPDPTPLPGSTPATDPTPLPGRAALAEQLDDLLRRGEEYTLANPMTSGFGGWWNERPLTRTPAQPPMDLELARQAAVLMLFCFLEADDDDAHLLLTERSPGLKKHPGQIAFPGGAQEDFDLDAGAAALREAQEEVGLDPSRVRVLGELPPAPVPISGFMVTPVIGVAEGIGVVTPQSGEVERVLPVRVDQLIRPQNRVTTVLRRADTVFSGPAFLVDETLIWGFTGILVDRMINRLGWEQPWDTTVSVDPRDHSPLL